MQLHVLITGGELYHGQVLNLHMDGAAPFHCPCHDAVKPLINYYFIK